MKKIYPLATMLAGLASGGQVQAQVTLYGLLDTGVTYTNNTASGGNSGSALQLMSGVAQGERWGLRGTETISGTLRAVFALESGFQSDTGAPGQGGRLFGRQAYAGLSGDWGTLTLGRQYDLISDYMPGYALAANTPAGLLAWSLPAYAAGGYQLDNRVWGDWVDNAVKYVSPDLGGLSFGAMAGLGEAAGSVSKRSTVSAGANYARGPVSAAVGYYRERDAFGVGTKAIYIAGAAYEHDALRIFASASDVRLDGGSKPRALTLEAGAVYKIWPSLSAGLGYQFQRRNNDLTSASQIGATLDYQFSRRTDAYMAGTYATDNAFNAQAVAALGQPATGSRQLAARIGLRHRF